MNLVKLAKQKGLTAQALAAVADVSLPVLSNIAAGNNKNRRARRIIQELLQEHVWPDLPAPPATLSFHVGDSIESPSPENAKLMACQLQGFVQREGTVLRFTRLVQFQVLTTGITARKPLHIAAPVFDKRAVKRLERAQKALQEISGRLDKEAPDGARSETEEAQLAFAKAVRALRCRAKKSAPPGRLETNQEVKR